MVVSYQHGPEYKIYYPAMPTVGRELSKTKQRHRTIPSLSW